jgi:hypothetical protein
MKSTIKALARKHGKATIETLAAIMNQADGPAMARLSAAQALLDRGWGKVALRQPVEEEEQPLLARTDRVIVDTGERNGGQETFGGGEKDAQLQD